MILKKIILASNVALLVKQTSFNIGRFTIVAIIQVNKLREDINLSRYMKYNYVQSTLNYLKVFDDP